MSDLHGPRLAGAIIAGIFAAFFVGLIILDAIARYRRARAGIPPAARGRALTVLCMRLAGVKRRWFESDRSLRRRAREALMSVRQRDAILQTLKHPAQRRRLRRAMAGPDTGAGLADCGHDHGPGHDGCN